MTFPRWIEGDKALIGQRDALGFGTDAAPSANAEVHAVSYFINDAKDPGMVGRDAAVLSEGHAHPIDQKHIAERLRDLQFRWNQEKRIKRPDESTPARRTGGTECCFCELPIDKPGFGLPMYEGEVVSVRDKEKLSLAGGFDCCRKCYEAYTAADLRGLKIRWEAVKDMRLIRTRIDTMRKTAEEFVRFLESQEI